MRKAHLVAVLVGDVADGVLEALTLGMIQGVAEWLPVSSEGLTSIAARNIFGRGYLESLETAIWLHVGTLIAAIAYFRHEIPGIVSGLWRDGEGRRLLVFLTLSTLSTAVTGIPLLLLLRLFPIPDSISSLTIGIILILMALMGKRNRYASNSDINNWKAVITGLAQGLAIIPGVSRSGITVIALLAQRTGLTQSMRLSFLMSIPATAAAQLALPVILNPPSITPATIISLASAAILGWLTMSTLINLSKKTAYTKIVLILGAVAIVAAVITVV
jgi:undecaprenyl-diphosphatase